MFVEGQFIEVVIGEYYGDRNGRTFYSLIDIERIHEDEVAELFPNENVLYIEEVKDEDQISWAKENPISELMKKKS